MPVRWASGPLLRVGTEDRRTVLMLAQLAPFAVSAVLLIQTMSGSVSLPLVYFLVVVLGLASSFENPARQALLPHNAVYVLLDAGLLWFG